MVQNYTYLRYIFDENIYLAIIGNEKVLMFNWKRDKKEIEITCTSNVSFLLIRETALMRRFPCKSVQPNNFRRNCIVNSDKRTPTYNLHTYPHSQETVLTKIK